MNQKHSTSTKSTKAAGGDASPRMQSARRSAPITRLQRSAGNQAVSGLIPIQRKLSEKLDNTTADGRDEDDFLGVMGRVLGETGSNNPVVGKLLQHSTFKTDGQTTGGGRTPKTTTGDGTTPSVDGPSTPATLQAKKERLALLKAQNAGGSGKTGVEDSLDKQLKEQERLAARKAKQDQLARLERQASGNLTEEDKQELADEKLDTELADKKSLAAKTAQLAKLQNAGGPPTAEEKLDKQIKELDKHNKLVAEEQESKQQWADLKKNPNPKGWGELPGSTGAAYQKSVDKQNALKQAGTSEVETVTSGNQLSLAKRLKNSVF